MKPISTEHFDVIIVGAGLSGIGAARQLQEKCPGKSFVVLEARADIGGTWDLFRYPGIRSDSDMYTMGYDSKPWREPKAIADGPSILTYIKEAASETGIDKHIRFGHKVHAAAWSSDDARWTVTAAHGEEGGEVQVTGNMLFMCSGYYSYARGYTPEFEGYEDFRGDVVHPQQWPDALDYTGKRVVVIGSGATAMTVVPAMAKTAAQVTMLQRSPTYVVSMPAVDPIATLLNKCLPQQLAYRLIRWKNVQFQRYVYRQTRINPGKVKDKLLSLVRKRLGPDYDVDKHFTPDYDPWDQRLCLIPDGDLFDAIKAGDVTVRTEEIKRFTADGILLTNGEELAADIIVTATGLQLEIFGGASVMVDGESIEIPDTFSYKGMMFSDIPNFVYTLGYINASWTLRSELVAEFVCRVVNHLSALGMRQCTPRLRAEDQGMPKRMMVEDFTPGYMRRSMHLFPRQSDRDPWRNTQNYLLDKKLIRHASLEDGVLTFSNPVPTLAETQAAISSAS